MDVPGNTTGPRAPPFALHGSYASTDLDEARGLASAAQHSLTMEPVGPARLTRFQLHQHPLRHMVLTRAALQYDGNWRVSAPPLELHYYLRIPLDGREEVRHGTRVVHPDPERMALLLSPGEPTTMNCVGGFDEFTVEIDTRAVDRTWQALTSEEPRGQIVFDPALQLSAEPGRSIHRLLGFLADDAYHPGRGGKHRMRSERLEEALILALLQHQPHSHDARLRDAPGNAGSTLVREAEAWLESRCADEVTITAAAAAQGVTIRRLQRAFERHRAYTPQTFLRSLMLRRARSMLQRGQGESVTRIALDVGFRHLGRFSGDYRERYGESPSQTLLRGRRTTRDSRAQGGDPIEPAGFVGLEETRGSCGFCRGDVTAI